MENELIERPMEYSLTSGETVRLTMGMVKKYLVTGKPNLISDQELFYFMGVCKARKLNPFNKDCYLIKYTTDPAAIIVSIDHLRKVARRQPDCVGWQKGVIIQKADGAVRRSNGLVLDGEKVVGGWFEATPKGWAEPFILEVNLSGYVKRTASGDITRFWKPENQPTMIAKVAEAQGLRTIWGEDLQGLYTSGEVRDVDDTPPIELTPDRNGHFDAPDVREKFIQAVNAAIYRPPETPLDDHVEAFLKATLQNINVNGNDPLGVEDIMRDVLESNRVNELLNNAKAWSLKSAPGQQKAQGPDPAPEPKAPPSDPDAAFAESWKYLRKAENFKKIVIDHIQRFKEIKTQSVYTQALNKWESMIPGEACPFERVAPSTVVSNGNWKPPQGAPAPQETGDPGPAADSMAGSEVGRQGESGGVSAELMSDLNEAAQMHPGFYKKALQMGGFDKPANDQDAMLIISAVDGMIDKAMTKANSKS